MKKLLTTRQAADHLSLSKSSLDQMRVKGGGPRFVKVGKKVLYDVADLDAWIEAHKQASTADRPELRSRRRRATVLSY
jgi:excisionase family DNA binding protein